LIATSHGIKQSENYEWFFNKIFTFENILESDSTLCIALIKVYTEKPRKGEQNKKSQEKN